MHGNAIFVPSQTSDTVDGNAGRFIRTFVVESLGEHRQPTGDDVRWRAVAIRVVHFLQLKCRKRFTKCIIIHRTLVVTFVSLTCRAIPDFSTSSRLYEGSLILTMLVTFDFLHCLRYRCRFESFGASMINNLSGPHSISDGLLTRLLALDIVVVMVGISFTIEDIRAKLI